MHCSTDKPVVSEIIPVKQILGVKKLKGEWFLKANQYYFEFFYKSRFIFGCQNEGTTNLWVQYIYQAIIFAQYLERLIESQ
jgi:hypothetical protein